MQRSPRVEISDEKGYSLAEIKQNYFVPQEEDLKFIDLAVNRGAGELGRVLNTAKLQGELKEIGPDFYRQSVKLNTRVNSDLYQESMEQVSENSVFDDHGNLKPWLSEIIPDKKERKRINTFIKQLMNLSLELAHDKQGRLRPWIQEFSNKKFDEMLKKFGKEQIDKQFVAAVMIAIGLEEYTKVEYQSSENIAPLGLVIFQLIGQQNKLNDKFIEGLKNANAAVEEDKALQDQPELKKFLENARKLNQKLLTDRCIDTAKCIPMVNLISALKKIPDDYSETSRQMYHAAVKVIEAAVKQFNRHPKKIPALNKNIQVAEKMVIGLAKLWHNIVRVTNSRRPSADILFDRINAYIHSQTKKIESMAAKLDKLETLDINAVDRLNAVCDIYLRLRNLLKENVTVFDKIDNEILKCLNFPEKMATILDCLRYLEKIPTNLSTDKPKELEQSGLSEKFISVFNEVASILQQRAKSPTRSPEEKNGPVPTDDESDLDKMQHTVRGQLAEEEKRAEIGFPGRDYIKTSSADLKMFDSALESGHPGNLGRVFDHAESQAKSKKIFTEFFQPYLADPKRDKAFEMDEFIRVSQENRDDTLAVYDDNGNLAPWIATTIPESERQPLAKFIKGIYQLTINIVHDEQGFFHPWLYDFLGKQQPGDEKGRLEKATDQFGEEIVRQNIIKGVALCLAGNIKGTTEKLPNLNLIIPQLINRQMEVNGKFIYEMGRFENTMKNLKKPDELRKFYEKALEHQKKLLTNPCVDSGKFIPILGLANAIDKLSHDPALYNVLFRYLENVVDQFGYLEDAIRLYGATTDRFYEILEELNKLIKIVDSYHALKVQIDKLPKNYAVRVDAEALLNNVSAMIENGIHSLDAVNDVIKSKSKEVKNLGIVKLPPILAAINTLNAKWDAETNKDITEQMHAAVEKIHQLASAELEGQIKNPDEQKASMLSDLLNLVRDFLEKPNDKTVLSTLCKQIQLLSQEKVLSKNLELLSACSDLMLATLQHRLAGAKTRDAEEGTLLTQIERADLEEQVKLAAKVKGSVDYLKTIEPEEFEFEQESISQLNRNIGKLAQPKGLTQPKEKAKAAPEKLNPLDSLNATVEKLKNSVYALPDNTPIRRQAETYLGRVNAEVGTVVPYEEKHDKKIAELTSAISITVSLFKQLTQLEKSTNPVVKIVYEGAVEECLKILKKPLVDAKNNNKKKILLSATENTNVVLDPKWEDGSAGLLVGSVEKVRKDSGFGNRSKGAWLVFTGGIMMAFGYLGSRTKYGRELFICGAEKVTAGALIYPVKHDLAKSLGKLLSQPTKATQAEKTTAAPGKNPESEQRHKTKSHRH